MIQDRSILTFYAGLAVFAAGMLAAAWVIEQPGPVSDPCPCESCECPGECPGECPADTLEGCPDEDEPGHCVDECPGKEAEPVADGDS